MRDRVFQQYLHCDGVERRPSLEDITDLFFGREGRVYQKFRHVSGFESFETFQLFIGTVLYCATLGAPLKKIKDNKNGAFWYLDRTMADTLMDVALEEA